MIDFGDRQPKLDNDYPDFIVPLALAFARKGGARRGHLWECCWGIDCREQSGFGEPLYDRVEAPATPEQKE